MAIKGYSDKDSIQLHNALPTFGKLKKGGEKGKNRPGQDLDYYRVDFDEAFLHLKPDFVKMYGDSPRTFDNVMLPSALQDNVFDSWYQAFGGNGTLKTQCDGENQVLYWVDGQGYEREKPKPCAMKNGICPNQCNSRGYLLIILPDFCEAIGQLGFFTVQTSSLVDIQHIASVLAFVSGIGELDNQRYTLTRTKKSFAPLIKGRRAKVEKWMILLQPQSIIPSAHALPAPEPNSEQLPEPAPSHDNVQEMLAKFADTVDRYLGISIAQIFNAIGITDTNHFVDTYPTWDAIKIMMLKLVSEESLDIRVYGCVTSHRNQNGTDARVYTLPFIFGLVPIFGRKIFREAGYNVDDDYLVTTKKSDNIQNLGNHPFELALDVEYIVIKVGFNKNGNLKVVSIADNPNEDFLEGDIENAGDPNLELDAHGLGDKNDNPFLGYAKAFDENEDSDEDDKAPPQLVDKDDFPI